MILSFKTIPTGTKRIFLLWVTPDLTTTNMAARNAGKEILSSNSSFHEAESMKMHCVMNDVVVMIMITYEITRSPTHNIDKSTIKVRADVMGNYQRLEKNVISNSMIGCG